MGGSGLRENGKRVWVRERKKREERRKTWGRRRRRGRERILILRQGLVKVMLKERSRSVFEETK